MLEEIVRQSCPVRGHEINRLDGAQCNDVIVFSAITHDAHRFDRQEHRKRLARLVVEVVFSQLLDEDVVSQLQQRHVLAFHFADDPDAQAGTGKRMPHDDLFRQAQFEADLADLILEQLTQGLDQFHAHLLRQAAHVVMRLDDVRLAGLGAGRFDNVGIDRALRQPLDALELVRLLVEHLDEIAADDLAFFFRIADSLERGEEPVGGIDANDVDTEVFAEGVHNLVAFVVPQQSRVDKHAG